jgi:hypothetical protein
VPGVDVQERERKPRRPERLLGEAEQDDRVLAAGEQKAGSLTLGCELAQDVNGLVFKRVEVGTAIGANDSTVPSSVITDKRPVQIKHPPAAFNSS